MAHGRNRSKPARKVTHGQKLCAGETRGEKSGVVLRGSWEMCNFVAHSRQRHLTAKNYDYTVDCACHHRWLFHFIVSHLVDGDPQERR